MSFKSKDGTPLYNPFKSKEGSPMNPNLKNLTVVLKSKPKRWSSGNVSIGDNFVKLKKIIYMNNSSEK